jgi:hypothetical protein
VIKALLGWRRVAWWLRNCATSRKVLGSIPGDVTDIFSVESDNSMSPKSAQPLKICTRILLGVKTAGL